jgi:hypothetical protein
MAKAPDNELHAIQIDDSILGAVDEVVAFVITRG